MSAPLAALPPWPTLLTLLPVLYIACATPFLVVFDVRHRRLPNVIVLPGIALTALSTAAAALFAHTDPGSTALVAAVTLLVFATFRVAGALASGDVKLAVLLAAALAPLASASLTLYALAGSTSALTAGLAALLLLARTRRRSHASARRARALSSGAPTRRRSRASARRSHAFSSSAPARRCSRALGSHASARRRTARPTPSGRHCAHGASVAPVAAEASTLDIPLGPFLLLGFWVAVTTALLFPPP